MGDEQPGSTGGAEDPGPRGLQRERTLLAWNRSVLALLVTLALLVRLVGAPFLRPAHLPAIAVAVVVTGTAAAVALLAT